ncbi:hypothetical protein B0T16DRAFT_417229 [Cercophora newfieldiana]|uniref:Uncharacterized protein n=1 Tax=Cercophora newfieldiana TaxID=92897 RepID=A0AA40CM85_9PEZI|nr:hypothetical protein B0T16DRAFT_417229 [Cercophora newfieldiana]
MSMVPLGVSSSLHYLVQGAENLLTQAENACTTLRSTHTSDHTCTALIQLNQALLDGREYVQREYDHISNAHGNSTAFQGDQTAKVQFWIICTKIEDRITKPLERLAQQFLVHQAHHGHDHGHGHTHHHCHFCRSYYYHHHHSRHVHFGVLVAQGSHHHGHNHHHLSEYEAKFQDMSTEWSGIKGIVSSCFDELEGRLKKDAKKKTDSDGGSSDKKDKSVAEAAQKMIEAANTVDMEMRCIANVEDRIHTMAGILHRGSRAASYVSSSSSSLVSL